MAELKIKADSGGGTVSWKGPATTTSNAAVQLTLPVDDGTANQYLKTDGSGALSWATVTDTDTLSFRRLNINGAAQIAQRGSTDLPASPTEGSTYGAVDRYAFVKNGALAVTLTQDTDVPTGQGFGKSMKIDVVTADDQAAADYFHLRYKFEGQDVQHIKKGTANAEKVTVQFWIKSTITGTYVANLYDSPNNRHVGATYTVSSADTWEKKTMTFPADTTGTFANSNANSMELRLHFEAGSNFTSGTLPTSWAGYSDANTAVGQVNAVSNASNNIYLTGIQIEIGDTATDFEHRPYVDEFQRCMRYYWKAGHDIGGDYPMGLGNTFWSGTRHSIGFITPVPMRSTPSISDTGDSCRIYGQGTNKDVTSYTDIGISGPYVRFVAHSGDLGDDNHACHLSNRSSSGIVMSAEL